MNWKGFRFVLVFATVLCVTGLTSCAHEQQLTSINLQPKTETFGAANIPVSADAGSSVQLRALGSYIHPPVTKDITNQVTWDSNTQDVVTVNSAGLLTATGLACGNALVSATVTTNKSIGNVSSTGAIVTGFMTANVVCFTGAGPTLTVTFAGTGSGSITSSPAGLGCATTCSASFASGTAVTLTATPNGSTFGGWAGCDSVSGQQCTVNLNSNRTVTVTFN
jgi:List-Bact-rpt repeat protein/Big-like domain-containing protein